MSWLSNYVSMLFCCSCRAPKREESDMDDLMLPVPYMSECDWSEDWVEDIIMTTMPDRTDLDIFMPCMDRQEEFEYA